MRELTDDHSVALAPRPPSGLFVHQSAFFDRRLLFYRSKIAKSPFSFGPISPKDGRGRMGVLIVLDTFEGDAILRKRQKPRSKLTRTSASQSPRTVQYASNCSTHDAPGSTTVLPPFKSVQSTKFFFRHKNHFSSPVQGRRSVIIVSSLRRLPLLPPPSSRQLPFPQNIRI